MNAGISAHFSPTIKSERDTWLRFVHTHHANLNPSGKFVAGVVKSILAEECFSRAFHMEGCRCRLVPSSIPTMRKIEPGKHSSKRQHRKVSSHEVFFFVEVSHMFIPSHLCDWKYIFK